MLWLGGARVAEFAHRSMSLPSPRTARRNTIIRPLVVSPSAPTVAEVEANIISCLEALDVEGKQSPPWHTDIISFDSTLGGPSLRIGNAIAVLVRCEAQIFLAIAQILCI
jgi:hypothetical protein